MNQIEATARFWFAYLEQDEYWLPKDGDKIRVADMDVGWAGNAGRWLDRRAAIVEAYYTHGELIVLSAPVPVVIGEIDGRAVERYVPGSNMLPAEGSMAELAFQREQDERTDDPVAWLATTPLRRALAARAAGWVMSEKVTEFVPVIYALSRARSYPRPVHLRRIVKVKIGNDFRGEPVWSQYPDRDALCGVHATERVDGEPTCADCKMMRSGYPDESQGR